MNRNSPLLKNSQEILRNNVLTASKEELTLLLYEGAVKYINQAVLAIKNKDLEKANSQCTKAQSIISELRATLDLSYDIAHQMETMYVYIYERLIEGNNKKDPEILEEVCDLVRVFRDTWKEAMVAAKNKK